jgi:hypothetical protein
MAKAITAEAGLFTQDLQVRNLSWVAVAVAVAGRKAAATYCLQAGLGASQGLQLA